MVQFSTSQRTGALLARISAFSTSLTAFLRLLLAFSLSWMYSFRWSLHIDRFVALSFPQSLCEHVGPSFDTRPFPGLAVPEGRWSFSKAYCRSLWCCGHKVLPRWRFSEKLSAAHVGPCVERRPSSTGGGMYPSLRISFNSALSLSKIIFFAAFNTVDTWNGCTSSLISSWIFRHKSSAAFREG
jgi:hypothetical protein